MSYWVDAEFHLYRIHRAHQLSCDTCHRLNLDRLLQAHEQQDPSCIEGLKLLRAWQEASVLASVELNLAEAPPF